MAWWDFIKRIRQDEEDERRRDQEGGIGNRVSGFLDDVLDVGGRAVEKAAPVRDFAVDVARSIPRGAYSLAASVGEVQQDTGLSEAISTLDEIKKLSYDERKKRAAEDKGFKVMLDRFSVGDPTDEALNAAQERAKSKRDDNSTFRPSGILSKVLGDEPIQTIQERRRGMEENIRTSPTFSGVADAATPLSFVGAAGAGLLDSPVGSPVKGGKKALERTFKAAPDKVDEAVDVTKPILPSNARPGAEVQKSIEDALNSGDTVKAQQLVDTIDDADLKAGMQSTLDSLSGKRTTKTMEDFLPKTPETTSPKVVKYGDDADSILDLMKSSKEIEKMRPGGGFKEKAYQQFFDKLSPINRLVKQVEEKRGAKLATEENPYELMRLYNGMPAQVKQRVTQVTDALDKTPDVDAVRVLGVARRVLGRPDIPSTVSPERAQRAITQLEAKLGADGFKAANDAVDTIVGYNETLLKELADAGVFTPDAVDEIITKNPDYFARFNVVNKLLEQADRDMFRSGQTYNLSRQNVVKAMKGMEENTEILDPIESIVKATDLSMRTAAKNRIWQSVNNLADEAPDLIVRVRDPENVAERMALSLENKELRPIRNKVDRLIKTRGGWVRQLQSEINKLEQKGLQVSLKEGGRTPLPQFSPAGLGGELPTSQAGKLKPIDFIADMEGNVRGNDAARIDRLGRGRDAAKTKADELLGPQGEGLIPVRGNEEGIAAARRADSTQGAIDETIRKRGTAQDFPVNPSQLGPQDTARFVRSLVEGSPKEVERLKKMVATREPKLAGILDEIGSLSSQYDELAGTIRGNVERARGELADLDVPEGFDVIAGFKDGVGGKLAIPKEMADVYKGMTPSQMNYLTKIVSNVNRVMKESVTSLSLPFAFIRNPIRDFKAMASNSKNIPARLDKIVKAWGGGFASAIKQDEMYQRWIQAGGGGAGIYSNLENAEDLAREVTRKVNGVTINNAKDLMRETGRILAWVPRKASEVIQKAGATLEAAPRLAEFKGAVDKGLSDQAAAMAARNVTVDFNQSGTVGQVMNQWVPFLNARLQGNKKLLEAAKRNPARFAGVYTTLTAAPMIATIAWNQQFPEVLEQIPANVKDNNFLIIMGDEKDEKGNFTQVVKIPKGDMDKIFGNPLENFLNYFAGQDTKGFGQVVGEMVGSVLPVDVMKDGSPNLSRTMGGLLPVAAKVPIEQATNRNLYFDSPIVPESMQDLPNDMQVRDNTPAVDKFLAGLTGASPIKTQAARQGVTGQLFTDRPDEALGAAVTGAQSTAVTNEFYKILGDTAKDRAGTSRKVNEAIERGDYQEAMQIAEDYNIRLRESFSPWAERYGKYAPPDLQEKYNEQKLTLTKRGLKQRRRNQLEGAAR